MSTAKIIHGDCIPVMRGMAAQSVDLVFGSPPYEDARTYGIDFKLKGQDWVDWMVEVFRASLHVSRGLVAFVLEGRTRDFRWSATPALLMADLHRTGIHLRKPPAFHRVGVPGSGGPDWLRNDYEFIVCATNGGKLPWSDNTAMGHIPRWAPGGEMSNRLSDGQRVNQWGKLGSGKGNGARKADGTFANYDRPSHKITTVKERRVITKPREGMHGGQENTIYNEPDLANPGNVLRYVVGGAVMGDRLCHENEAPFPEDLAEFFIRSFCPEGGTVLEPFSGSGTTCKVAISCNRNAIGIDVRESEVKKSKRRIGCVQRTIA